MSMGTTGPLRRRWKGIRRTLFARLGATAAAAAAAAAIAPGCSLGEGTGSVTGTLNIPMCWSGAFNLQPTFFAAVPYNSGNVEPDATDLAAGEVSALEIRIQNGTDYESFSDGVMILVDNVHQVRGDPPYRSELGKPLAVALPPGVVPPGTPIPPVANPATVSLTLYLNASCATENVSLYALDEVSLNADGTCDPTQAGPLILACDAGLDAASDAANPDAGASDAGMGGEAGTGKPQTASSSITFQHLFDDNPYESNAAQRFTQATFDVYLGDPRTGCPGGLGPPPPCRGHIQGSFSFYFQRGQPAQPFQ
jgi:hypothetical protein